MSPDEELNDRPTDESAEKTSDASAAPTPETAPETAPDDANPESVSAVASATDAAEDATAEIVPIVEKAVAQKAVAQDVAQEDVAQDVAQEDVVEVNVVERAAGAEAADNALTPSDVVAFWRAAGPKRWFAKDDAFDAEIRTRFEALHHKAARGELDDWADEPEGALALLLLLDQFPRNLYRGAAHAFATDPLARQIAGRAVERGFDQHVAEDMRLFFYLPFEHSEDARDQENAVALIAAMGDEDLTHWAQVHAETIARFGRFPHRNACLGRVTTDTEKRFLAEGGFSA